MGSRHGKNVGKEDDGGKVVERSGSKRGSGRKKKKATDDVVDSAHNDVIVDGKKTTKSNAGAKKDPEVKGRANDVSSGAPRRAMDDGDLGKRPKMGRLSGSFGAGDTQSRKGNNFAEVDSHLPDGVLSPKTAELKVYRSYSSLVEEKKVTMYDGQPSLANVKVYRKTPETPLNPSQRAMSLPRGFERTRNTLAGHGNGRAGGRDFTDRGAWNDKRVSAPAMRSSTLPRLQGNASTPSSSAAGYRVSTNDMPSTLAIQRRLKQFENLLVRNILTKFSRLDPESQLSAVPIAIKLGRPNQFVTLRDYVENPYGLPDDIVDRASTGEFILCIAPAMFTGMAHFRREKSADRNHWPTLARDVVTCVAAEAAAEISRMFEYQISLLTGDSSVALLADHGAERILSFILHDLQTPRLDRNTAIQGVVRGNRAFNPQSPTSPLNPVFISVIVGMKELKWNLHEIFDKPGLRKDVMLVHEGVPAPGDDDRCPWKFYTSHSSDPMLYGYRGQLIEWDFIEGHFRVNRYDETSYSEEMSWRFDDFHRLYPPFRRLFGSKAMKRYYTEHARAVGRQPLRLDRFLLQAVQGAAYARDAIQPVYRPLEPFTLADVEGLDFSSADVPRVLLPKSVGGPEVKTPLSPSGEFPVFSSSGSVGLRAYSQGGAIDTLTVPNFYSPDNRLSNYSPGGGTPRQSYSPDNRSPTIPQYYPSPGGDRSPGSSPYYDQNANQQFNPILDRPITTSMSFPPTGNLQQSYSSIEGKPTVAEYYSPGGTLRKIRSPPPEVEVKMHSLEVGPATVKPHYSPGGTLRRGLPANGKQHSQSSGNTTPRSHSPGGAAPTVVQNHSKEVATMNSSFVGDSKMGGFMLVEEVTTVHSIKASNV